jgi:alpha-tubulin suppressor-like RCC1 family protein
MSDGKLLAWGQNYPGDIPTADLMTPKLIKTDFEAVDIAAGNKHTAALDNKGIAYTWGDNGAQLGGGGHLGLGSHNSESSPRYLYLSPQFLYVTSIIVM